MIKNFTNFSAELALYFSLFLLLERRTIEDDQVNPFIFFNFAIFRYTAKL